MKKILVFCVFLIAFAAVVSAEKKEQESDESSEESKKEEVKKEEMRGEDEKTIVEAERKAVDEQIAVSERKGIDKMIIGRFDLTTSPRKKDYKELLKAMKYKRSHMRAARRVKKYVIRITKQKGSDDKYVIWTRADFFHLREKFQPGKEFTGNLFDGRTYKGVITFKGNSKFIKDEKHDGFECHNKWEFEEDGLTIKYDCNGKQAERRFKRGTPGKQGFLGFFGFGH